MNNSNNIDIKIPSIEEQLKSLDALSESEIDLSDIPEIEFTNSERGRFYRPIKQPVTLRLDADIVAWFKHNNKQYQTAINKALREYISTQA